MITICKKKISVIVIKMSSSIHEDICDIFAPLISNYILLSPKSDAKHPGVLLHRYFNFFKNK